MLPQLKWRTLNDADMTQLPFVAKKGGFKCDYRGFGGSGGRNVADFLGGASNKHLFPQKQKYMLYVFWVDQIHAILAYFDDFCLN